MSKGKRRGLMLLLTAAAAGYASAWIISKEDTLVHIIAFVGMLAWVGGAYLFTLRDVP